ncbi:MAG: PIN domain-containing protein [Chloroflexota bacterium]|nr:PIN domain-containing protein [Chloroflexota bacterium]
MSGYLLDTNVVSELVRETPTSRVVDFFLAHQDLWLSTIVVHELEFGLRRLPEGQRKRALEAKIDALFTNYADSILPLERPDAEWAARFRAQEQRSGRVLELGDALIAGTARAHDLVLVTRNVTDFLWL